jgi:hypothetical protein
VVGVQGALGAGVIGFIGGGTRAVTEPGGSWDVRVTAGTLLSGAAELAYIGSAQGLRGLGADSGARLIGNGVETGVRINFTRTCVLQPYLFGGFGWIDYQIANTNTVTADVSRTDNVWEVPFGSGLTARVAWGLVLDARFTGRLAFHDTLFDHLNTAGARDLHSWNGTGRLGWEF